MVWLWLIIHRTGATLTPGWFLGAICPDGTRAETVNDGDNIVGTCTGRLDRQ